MLKINTLRTFFGPVLGARTALLAATFMLLMGCSQEKTPEKTTADCAPLPPLQYSKNLKIGTSCGEQMAEIRSIVGSDTLVKRFVLRPKGSSIGTLPKGLEGATVLQVPLARAVALSSAQVGFMARLGLENAIAAVGEGKFIADSALYERVQKGEVAEVGSGPTLSLEKLLALKPDLVMNFATGGAYDDYQRIEALGLPLMLTSEWQEEHPLAKAEWIKLFGILFDEESRADSVYRQSNEKYLSSSNGGVAGVSPARGGSEQQRGSEGETSPANSSEFRIPNSELPCPRVLVGMSYGGVWYAPGGNSYTAQLIQDAGGRYLWAGTEERELRLPLEQVIALADSADIWINPGMFSTAEEILGAEPRVARIKAFREKRVFQNDGRKGPGGGNDFYESAVAQPEKVLNDFVWAIGAFKDSEKADSTASGSRWYRNIFNF
ncbi:ABC transporter substrate-binding protein [Fibrobacter sp.]|uniref:ABC transporter substrate-binding protein n=1 Tax=Fibrobacter sp. TaxID=35828 RepID=UPI00388FBE3C